MTTKEGAPVLEISSLCKTYGGLQALQDVSLQLSEGDVVAVLGRSGSGKSSMLRCINLLEQPTSGTISIRGAVVGQKDGRPASGAELARQRSRIGMVFQQFNLFPHLSVLHNVSIGPTDVLRIDKSQAELDALEWLRQVGLEDKKDSYPLLLSGGQQQRVAIARAMAMKPELMLFDEPTSALDPETIGDVLEVMTSLAERGMTMLVATHEFGFARDVANRILFLHAGRVRFDGPPAEFFGMVDDPLIGPLLSRIALRAP